ncbi:MAG TPA: hypothetical protein VF393_03735 [archaeon]
MCIIVVAAGKRIIIIKWAAQTTLTTMLVAEHYQDLRTDFAMPKQELLGIHRSKISLHHAKSGYNYPSIRMPHTLTKLAGLSTRIYQTVHEGALAFLVVVSPRSDKRETSADRPAYLHGEGRSRGPAVEGAKLRPDFPTYDRR